MKKVLVIAYYFPPAGGGGVQRTLKFVKYLSEYGWHPVVLTVNFPKNYQQDASFESELPDNIPVYRSSVAGLPSVFPRILRSLMAQWLLIVDEQLGWFPFATRQAKDIIKKENIEVIYTTSSPYTSHLIGWYLKKQLNLPWVADFRDPWVDNFGLAPPTIFHRKLIAWLEKKVVTHADRVVVVSEPMRQALSQRHSEIERQKISVIPNGYDGADFNTAVYPQFKSGCMNIVYTGTFYGQQQTPKYFFQSLAQLLKTGSITPEKIKVHLVGNNGRATPYYIKKFDLAESVITTGYLPHRHSMGYLLTADLLLLIIGDGPGSEMVYTGKIFEYLASQRPILALVPPGVARDLMHRAEAGVVVPPRDVDQISHQLANLYQRWEQGTLDVNSNQAVVTRFDRRTLTAELAQLFDEICP